MRVRFVLASAILASCSQQPATRESPVLASAVVARVQRFDGYASHAGVGGALVRTATGYRLAPSRVGGFSSLGGPLGELPSAADGPVRVGEGDVTLEVRALDVAVGPAEVVGGAIVHRGRELDLLHVAEPGRLEELRVLRTPKPLHRATWSLSAGSALSIRVREATVEVLDATGAVRIASEPIVAIDAAGVRRTPTVRVESGTLVVELAPDGLTYPVLLDPAWTTRTSSTIARNEHTVTALGNGKVLVVGGLDSAGAVLSTAQLYDPTTNAWSSGGTMATARRRHAAVRLTSGKVLVTGGYPSTATVGTSAAELYDPVTNGWTSAGSESTPRTLHTSTLLSDGKVLVIGGYTGSVYTTVTDLYDPASGWSIVGSIATKRYKHTSTLLTGGKVLVAGGYGGVYSSTAEIYDPTTQLFTATGAMSVPRDEHVAVLLPTNKVLVTGGIGSTTAYWSTSELFDPAAGTWSSTGSMAVARTDFFAELLPNGKVLVAAGDDNVSTHSAAELYDPTAGTWSSAGAMIGARSEHRAAQLSAGRVFVYGGVNTGTRLSTAEMFDQAANGGSCANGYECESGFCVDGVCCNSACTAACQACDVATKVGTCSAVASGGPHGTRSCAPYLACVAGACASTCIGDTDCVATSYCSAGKCVAKRAAGTACGAGRECLTSQCADGVCCDVACAGQCEACDVTGKVGTCTAVTGKPVGTRPACTGTGAGTTCGQACGGVDRGKCVYPPTTTACSSNACSAGIETHASTCDGAGKCKDVPKACDAYACSTLTCKTTCTVTKDCAAGHYCDSGACLLLAGLGDACVDGSSCPTGFCVDGVCCAEGSCGAGKACNIGKKGTCTKNNGTTCAADGECGSGHCVDGVCCDTACTDVCAACDATGLVGTCSAIAGAPHGGRTACSDGAGDTCKARACDGKTTATCAGFVSGPSNTCKPASCADGMAIETSTCDGAGSCVTPASKACSPYACDGDRCATGCTDSSSCAKGFTCAGSKCVPETATCTDDGLSVREPSGATRSCAPFVCKAGVCVDRCTVSSDCRSGLVCDPSGTCIEPKAATGETSEEGGCSFGASRTSPGLLLALVALAMAGRSRHVRNRARSSGVGTRHSSVLPNHR